jgi:hypothetical protein
VLRRRGALKTGMQQVQKHKDTAGIRDGALQSFGGYTNCCIRRSRSFEINCSDTGPSTTGSARRALMSATRDSSGGLRVRRERGNQSGQQPAYDAPRDRGAFDANIKSPPRPSPEVHGHELRAGLHSQQERAEGRKSEGTFARPAFYWSRTGIPTRLAIQHTGSRYPRIAGVAG